MSEGDLFYDLSKQDQEYLGEVPTPEKHLVLTARVALLASGVCRGAEVIEPQDRVDESEVTRMYQECFLPLKREFDESFAGGQAKLSLSKKMMIVNCAQLTLRWLNQKLPEKNNFMNRFAVDARTALRVLRTCNSFEDNERADQAMAQWYTHQPYLGTRRTVEFLERVVGADCEVLVENS